MKWIREPDGFYSETFLGLTKNELALIQDVVKKLLPKYKKLYDKYRDIHDGGAATEKQQDKMFEYEEIVSTLKDFLSQ